MTSSREDASCEAFGLSAKSTVILPGWPDIVPGASPPGPSGDGTIDLEGDDVVVAPAKLTEDLIGVLRELRCPRHPDILPAEAHRAGDEFPLPAVGIRHRSYTAVGPQRGVLGHLPGVLHRGPLSLHALEQLQPLGVGPAGEDIGH